MDQIQRRKRPLQKLKGESVTDTQLPNVISARFHPAEISNLSLKKGEKRDRNISICLLKAILSLKVFMPYQ